MNGPQKVESPRTNGIAFGHIPPQLSNISN